jgi:energy-coupling factor transporter ATP-binding protein EcfA2
MATTIDPLSIFVTPQGDEGSYKSISTLTWENIPGFAVLTGKNGSGKTQLLEVLAYHFSGALPPPPTNILLHVRSEGAKYQPDEIGYVPSVGRFSGGGGTTLANLPSIRNQTVQYATNPQGYRHDVGNWVRTQKVQKLLAGENVHQISPERLGQYLKDDFEFALNDIDVTEGLCHISMAHRLKLLEALERRTPGLDRDGKELGPAPWDVVNESLVASGFPYQMIPPTETPILEHYSLRLRDRANSSWIIPAIDLSSGEKVLLQLVLWLFTAGKEGVFPRLLILDEPDAHLHPSMTQQFLDVISDVLVNKHGVRVIISTHSPSTVALAPEGSVFQMERDARSIVPVTFKPDIISVLTAGLVTVSKATKFCFLEDDADVSFYNTIRDVLTDYGPSRDPMAIRTSPTIAFIPASIGSGSSKVAGGSSVVAKWVAKLDADPLNRTFVGIIDGDNRNASNSRVRVIGRYSFENYLLDPIIIFALLSEDGRAPDIPGLKISSGDEHLLRTKDDATLQTIADTICRQLESVEQSLLGCSKTAVVYTTNQSITVPDWVLSHRGHDILPKMQNAFGGPGLINPKRLLKAVRRCRLIPRELAVLLADIQNC